MLLFFGPPFFGPPVAGPPERPPPAELGALVPVAVDELCVFLPAGLAEPLPVFDVLERAPALAGADDWSPEVTVVALPLLPDALPAAALPAAAVVVSLLPALSLLSPDVPLALPALGDALSVGLFLSAAPRLAPPLWPDVGARFCPAPALVASARGDAEPASGLVPPGGADAALLPPLDEARGSADDVLLPVPEPDGPGFAGVDAGLPAPVLLGRSVFEAAASDGLAPLDLLVSSALAEDLSRSALFLSRLSWLIR